MTALFLVMLSGDVSLNPGQSAEPMIVNNKAYSLYLSTTLDSMDDSLVDSSVESSPESVTSDSDVHLYFNFGLGDKGLHFGTWNVNVLTMSKFEQIWLPASGYFIN